MNIDHFNYALSFFHQNFQYSAENCPSLTLTDMDGLFVKQDELFPTAHWIATKSLTHDYVATYRNEPIIVYLVMLNSKTEAEQFIAYLKETELLFV